MLNETIVSNIIPGGVNSSTQLGGVLITSNLTTGNIITSNLTAGVGLTGATGPGVPNGGTANQAITKIDATNQNTHWSTIDKSFVGLSNVDNTSDVNKPVSTAQATAIALKADKTYVDSQDSSEAVTRASADSTLTTAVATKEPIITAGTSSQYYRGDKTMQTLNQDVVPDGTTNKAYTATEQTKLAGIATGATANTGTVTSLDVSGGSTGLTTSGGPVTNSGTITMGGTLGIANGGTGSATQNFVDLSSNQTVNGTKTFSNPQGTYFNEVFDSKVLPTNPGDEIDIGAFNISVGVGSGTLDMSVTVGASNFSVGKHYIIGLQYILSNSTWYRVQALSDSGPYASNDFQLEINMNGGTLSLRLARVGFGSLPGTAKIRMKLSGIVGTYTSSSASSSTITPSTTNFRSTSLTQTNSMVGVGDKPVSALLDIITPPPTTNPTALLGLRSSAAAWGISQGTETVPNMYVGVIDVPATIGSRYFWRANYNTPGVAANTFRQAYATANSVDAVEITQSNASNTGSYLKVSSNGGTSGDTLNVTNAGFVGIGNTSPTTLLSVGPGTATLLETASTYNGIAYRATTNMGQISMAGSTLQMGMLMDSGTSKGYMGTWTSHNLVLRTANVNRVEIGGTGILQATATSNASSSIATMFTVTPIFTQTGTAGYTAFAVNTTETSVGTGTKLLADFQVGSVSKASISNTGKLAITAFQLGSTATSGWVLTADASGNGTWQVADYVPMTPPVASYTYNTDSTIATATENGVTATYAYNSDGTINTVTRAGVTRTYSYNSDGTVSGVA